MQTYPECYACMLKTAQAALQNSDVAEAEQINALKKILAFLFEAPVHISPSHITTKPIEF